MTVRIDPNSGASDQQPKDTNTRLVEVAEKIRDGLVSKSEGEAEQLRLLAEEKEEKKKA
jgi:hypothetical protein